MLEVVGRNVQRQRASRLTAIALALICACSAAGTWEKVFLCQPGQRPATVVRVIDGDTAVLRLDLGFESFIEGPCRFEHIDAPELPTVEGLASRDWLRNRLQVGESVCFTGSKRDKYGRPLVTLFDSDGNVNVALVSLHFAKAMP
jgi:endonuclease YncB( thermonuclease family)